MGLTVDEIKANEHFEYQGNVRVTGSIGDNATVIVKDGNLTVEGNVGKDAEIKMQTTPIFGVINATNGESLEVKGNVGNNVTITSVVTSINVEGSIGEKCKFNSQSGSINVGNVGKYSLLKTMSGDVNADDVGTNCTLKTMSGDVNARNVERDSSLETMSGDVQVSQAHSSVMLQTISGSISENGTRRRPQSHQQGATISIGSFGLFGGGIGRVTLAGRDITHLINQSSSSAPAPQEAPAPIRYSKKY